jgi:hypothetical protein
VDLSDYKEKFGKEAIDRLCVVAGVKPEYMKHLVTYYKRPSADMAHRLISATDGQLTLAELLRPSQELKRLRANLRNPAKAHFAMGNEAMAKAAKALEAGDTAAVRRHVKQATTHADKAIAAIAATA